MTSIAVGSLLVLGTWVVFAVVVTAMGSGLAATAARTANRSSFIRHAMWWGVALLSGSVLLINLVLPLGHWGGLIIVLGIASVSAISATLTIGRRSRTFVAKTRTFRPAAVVAICVLIASQVYLAVAALGPVTNYDTGLYHLGAIGYGRDFPAVIGLANVYAPLGYGTAEFPLAAFYGSTPWQSDGFRLLNGFLMGLLALDLSLRLIQRTWTAGTYVMSVGVVAAWVPLLALSDYWVTSPSQDTASFVLIIVSASYLVDAVAHSGQWLGRISVSLVVAVIAVLIRPTMVVFLIGVVIVAAILMKRRRTPGSRRATVLVGLVTGVCVTAMLVRDVLLSGWLLFPLSAFPVPVSWRAADPAELRMATLGYHRNPDDLWSATQGWGWAQAWFARLPQMWESYELLVLVIVALIALLVAGASTTLRWRSLIVAISPSALAVIAWWTLTPPSFRFAWGPIFTVAAIPLGWSLWRLSTASSMRTLVHGATMGGLIVPVLAVVVFSSAVRLDVAAMTQERTWSLGIHLPYAVAPIPSVETEQRDLVSGIALRVPTTGEQCWGDFPLCTPTPNPGLALRGTSIREGFRVF